MTTRFSLQPHHTFDQRCQRGKRRQRCWRGQLRQRCFSLQPQHTFGGNSLLAAATAHFCVSGVSGVSGVAGVGGVSGVNVLLAAATAYFSNRRHENPLLAAATAYFLNTAQLRPAQRSSAQPSAAQHSSNQPSRAQAARPAIHPRRSERSSWCNLSIAKSFFLRGTAKQKQQRGRGRKACPARRASPAPELLAIQCESF